MLILQVMLTPNSSWGGEGSLGCGIGYGYLHRIPVKEENDQSHDPEMGKGGGDTTDAPAEGFADVSDVSMCVVPVHKLVVIKQSKFSNLLGRNQCHWYFSISFC